MQIDRVMQLLSTTELSLAKIADLAGFQHVESMCKLFKRKTGMTPGHYRKTWSEQGPRGGEPILQHCSEVLEWPSGFPSTDVLSNSELDDLPMFKGSIVPCVQQTACGFAMRWPRDLELESA